MGSWAHFFSPFPIPNNPTPVPHSLFNLKKVLDSFQIFSDLSWENPSRKNVEPLTLFLISAYDFVFFHSLNKNPILSLLGQLKVNSSILLISRKLAHLCVVFMWGKNRSLYTVPSLHLQFHFWVICHTLLRSTACPLEMCWKYAHKCDHPSFSWNIRPPHLFQITEKH